MSSTRRRFLRNTAVASAPLILPTGFLRGADAPSNRISVGMIGVGSMGGGHLRDLARRKEVQLTSLCDVDAKHREKALNHVKSEYGKAERGTDGINVTAAYEETCAREDVDAVLIATPDHWHAVAGITAARSGKHIYCQKPVTHLFREGQILRDEVAKAGVIFQVGSQQRSDQRFRLGSELVRNGVLGKIQKVEIGLPGGRSKADRPTGQPLPDHLDYERWVGPSEMIPYDSGRCHWSWRWHTYFGGGQLMDWIGHHNDIAHWGLGMDTSGPETVEAVGWKMPPADFTLYDTPVDYEVKCTYAGGYETSLSNKYPNGLKWIGENGWVFVKRGGIEASNPEWRSDKFDKGSIELYKSGNHMENWLDGIRTGKECICTAETGHRSITPGHLGWISYHTGRKLKWDPVAESVVGDAEADAMLKKLDYRGEWGKGIEPMLKAAKV